MNWLTWHNKIPNGLKNIASILDSVLGIVVMISCFYDVDQCLDAMAILAFVGATELEATESTMVFFWLIISHQANHFEDQVRYFFLTVMSLVYDYSSN
jgi:hypothetical protein